VKLDDLSEDTVYEFKAVVRERDARMVFDEVTVDFIPFTTINCNPNGNYSREKIYFYDSISSLPDNKTISLTQDNRLVRESADEDLCPIFTISVLFPNGTFSSGWAVNETGPELISEIKLVSDQLNFKLEDKYGQFFYNYQIERASASNGKNLD